MILLPMDYSLKTGPDNNPGFMYNKMENKKKKKKKASSITLLLSWMIQTRHIVVQVSDI